MTGQEFLWDMFVVILFILGCIYSFSFPIFKLHELKEKKLDPFLDPFFKKYFPDNKFFNIIFGLIYMLIFYYFTFFMSFILLSLWSYLCGFTPIEGIPFVNYWDSIIPSFKGIFDIH